MWNGYVKGTPLYTLPLDGRERDALRTRLRGAVRAAGLLGLVRDEATTRDFVLFASLYVADDAERLQWPPILRELGVAPLSEFGGYTALYDPIERALQALGREVITTPHGRRFLGTFLREGGLPVNIGNLPELIIAAAEDFGWNALQEERVRELATEHISSRATGLAARLFSGVEARSALDDLLATAAHARAMLVEAGVDPTTLRTDDEVRSALERASVPLPAVRNADLLVAVLKSFTREAPPRRAVLAPLRIVAQERGRSVDLLLHLELDALANAELPSGVGYVSLKADPCHPTRSRQQVRREAKTFTAANGEGHVRWPRTGAAAPSRVDAYFTGSGGAAQVVPVSTIEWEHADELWFDRHGEMLGETRGALQPGEEFLVVSWRDAELLGSGGVSVERLNAPTGAQSAWRVQASSLGELRLTAAGHTVVLECGTSALPIAVLQATAIPGLPKRFVRSLPDLALPEGIVVSVEVSCGPGGAPITIPRAAGFVRLAGIPAVRSVAGKVAVRVRAADGRTWAASWHVLPRGFTMRQLPGCVDLENAGHVEHVVRGTSRTVRDGRIRIEANPGETSVVALLRLQGGQRMELPIEVGARALRLWVDRALASALPPTPVPELTERMVLEGACLEVGGGEGVELSIRTQRGDTAIALTKRSTQRAFVGLSQLLDPKWRRNEARVRFTARLEPAGEEVQFGVHIPRLAPPEIRPGAEGALRLEFAIDERDVPTRPGLAFFPVAKPLAAPAIVPIDVELKAHRLVGELSATVAPTQRGLYVAFLVDRAIEPPRPMSNGRLLAVPLSGEKEAPPVPESASPLERALWLRSEQMLDSALADLASAPTFQPFVESFVEATRLRRPYGLDSLWLYQFVGVRALWLVLACALRLSEEEQTPWIMMWARQISGFTWLRLTHRDVELLRITLPQRTAEQRVSLLEKARAAHPMLRASEYELMQGLSRGNTLLPLSLARDSEINARSGHDVLKAPSTFALPGGGPATSWLRGAEPDVDVGKRIEAFLETQVMHGARARAIRELFLRKQLPGGHVQLRPLEGDLWARQVCDWIDAQWTPLTSTQLAYRLRDLDRECALAAIALAGYRRGRQKLTPTEFQHIVELEGMAPNLLDAWMIAVNLREGEPR